jgi:hypothetical protein
MTTPNKCEHEKRQYRTDRIVMECDTCAEEFVTDAPDGRALYLEAMPGTGNEGPCEGEPFQHDIKCGLDDVQFCLECGQRFIPEPVLGGAALAILERHANSVTIPSDVLEEALRILRKNENGSQYREEYCIECAGDMDGGGHEADCALMAVLRRIDAVLGRK